MCVCGGGQTSGGSCQEGLFLNSLVRQLLSALKMGKEGKETIMEERKRDRQRKGVEERGRKRKRVREMHHIY